MNNTPKNSNSLEENDCWIMNLALTIATFIAVCFTFMLIGFCLYLFNLQLEYPDMEYFELWIFAIKGLF